MDALRRSANLALAAAILASAAAVVLAANRAPDARASPPPATLKAGISDQKPAAFEDALLRGLGLGFARRSVAWDALRFRYQVRDIDAWMRTTRAAGMDPLVTFARSRGARRRHRPPSPAEMRRQFRRFHKRYPDVRTYSAWNEANQCGTGTCKRPGLVVSYYRIIRRDCPGCTVLAADLNDNPDPVPWARKFRRALGREPSLWGYHNYIDANRLQTTLTTRLLRAVKGDVWLTEVGGLVARRNHSMQAMPQGKARAALATRFIFDRLARLSPRISRIYLYHWSSLTRHDSWDSALIAPDGRPRPSLRVFEDVLREHATLRK